VALAVASLALAVEGQGTIQASRLVLCWTGRRQAGHSPPSHCQQPASRPCTDLYRCRSRPEVVATYYSIGPLAVGT